MLSPLKNAALVTSIAFGAVVMLTGGASAESFGTRCVGDRCYAVHCNNYEEHCRRVEPYERDYIAASITIPTIAWFAKRAATAAGRTTTTPAWCESRCMTTMTITSGRA
jgi:hypothetical protein